MSTTPGARPLPFASAAARVFELSLGQMLVSRRTVFMALLVGAPVLLAAAVRLLPAGGVATFQINGASVGAEGVFGLLFWVFFVRFIVPVLGLFYGTGLIADEVEDQTLTYLFTRPIPRAAVLIGKYAAYLVCASLVVLPAVLVIFFALMPVQGLRDTFPDLVNDLGILAVGLAVYGAVCALAGVVLRRPLVFGLAFVFGWEPTVLLLPGYLKRLTVADYMQALVPHAMPPDTATAALVQVAFRDVLPVGWALFGLGVMLALSLGAACRVVSTREYVLDR